MQYALGLGSNIGHRLQHLQQAINLLDDYPSISMLKVSRIYETEYVGDGVQDQYLNACCIIETELSPRELLTVVKAVEQEAGRLPDTHMQPRVLDIDLLLMKDGGYSDQLLQIPHLKLCDRQFVLRPLSEIAGKWNIFDSQLIVDELCKSEDDDTVQLRSELNLVLSTVSREAK
ncbi:MAG: 2-amino-4-hydroxy-6-hydroxymethyldihydropteridine diphosphokinase [bacterium]|nr:2-amino-4-hydroxy-6-hydroxymethyldihydropteridine diphosphokinase [bacterium]MCP4799779.1 2-amino-4-hydroxy-6-hydroxymethyldihydropteridine diphosphokinase [bacterium]